MGRQKAVIKAHREAKRVLRRDSRSHKQREEESVTSLVQMSGGVEAIGMARDSRDTSPIAAAMTLRPTTCMLLRVSS